MPKWTSPIFTDIRNALGESVVFSMWKGRPYMRSWVKPANPRTNKQQAHRDVLRQLVKRWQDVIDTAEKKAAWNEEALPYNITGFNLFTKFGRKSSISCPGTGSTTAAVTITYTLGLPATKAAILAFNGSTWEDITPPEGLSSEPNSTFEHTFSEAGTYELFIADKDVLVEGDTPPQPYQAITKWSPDIVAGVAKEAKIVIS